jgi:WD40 repeat protein
MSRRLAALGAALLALAACSGGPPEAIPAEGGALDARPVARFVHHRGEARELAFTPDGRMLIATGTDGRIELMPGATGAVWRTIVHPGGASPIALSPDGTHARERRL